MARAPRPSPAPTGLSPAWWFVLLFLAAFVVYHPALHGGFIWDDDGHVTRPDLRSLDGLFRIWFEVGATQQYYPLLHSAFWLEHRLWGDSALGYHLVNVLLHATAAGLFATVLRRLAVPGAWLAAGLFLLHPVCVESVAWISEQKNTLSLVLYLAAILAWLRFDRDRRPAGYALATGLFGLALLTKTVTATLPAALLVVAWWRHGPSTPLGALSLSKGRLDWRRDVRPLLPWFVLGAGGGLLTAHFERVFIGAQGADFALGLPDRLVLAGRVFWFYLGKLLWPADLIFSYPRWTVDAGAGWQWLFPAAGLGLLAALVWWARRSRAPLAAALLFGGALFPVLGFFNVYPFLFSYVADHFQYLASLGVFALAGAGLSRLPRAPGLVAAVGLAAALGALSWRQADTYRDVFTLYETTLRRNPGSWLTHNNLAMELADAGRVAEAIPHLEAALRLRPNFPQALSNLGADLTKVGRPREAIPPLEEAIRQQPVYAEAHNNLGAAYMALNRPQEGHDQFFLAVTMSPKFALAHRNLGQALASAGRVPEALPHFERAVQLNPADAQAELNLASALTQQSRYAEAVPHFEAALALDPESADAHFRLALTLRSLGRTADANGHYQEAVRLNPGLAR